jgi:hypothetical protein
MDTEQTRVDHEQGWADRLERLAEWFGTRA